jgi:hypothetical protein
MSEVDEKDTTPPQKVADIILAGKKYELAKNGSFMLAEDRGMDLYGRPFAVKVVLGELTTDEVQGLLDLFGEAYQSLRHTRDSRLASRTEGSVGTTTEHSVRGPK